MITRCLIHHRISAFVPDSDLDTRLNRTVAPDRYCILADRMRITICITRSECVHLPLNRRSAVVGHVEMVAVSAKTVCGADCRVRVGDVNHLLCSGHAWLFSL